MAELLALVAKAAEELFTEQLGFRGFAVVGRSSGLAVTDVGAYVALVGDEPPAQVGLVASIDTCRLLARQMLVMDVAEELVDGDMCDAIGEIAHLLGDSTTRLLKERGAGLKLGLPLFIQGRLIASQRQEVGSLTVRIGAAVASLIVLRPKKR
jgi:CheY-specific phosphatase CheX